MPSPARRLPVAVALLACASACVAAAPAAKHPGGVDAAQEATGVIAPPTDRAFAGQITLDVDATDTAQKIFRAHEVIPVQAAGPLTLLYPEWEISSHGRTVSAASLAGLAITANGVPIPWTRDAVDMHAFHLSVPEGTGSLMVDLQYITRVDEHLLRDDLVSVAWQHVLVYPAGWSVRNIPVQASLKLPKEMTLASSLTTAGSDPATGETRFSPVSLGTLLDSPVLASRFSKRVALGATGQPPMQLDVMASDPADLAIGAGDLAALKKLVRETGAVMGRPPYDHFDGLVVLSDDFSTGGNEHVSSAEIHLPAGYFREPATQLNNRDLIAHEHVHAWNGRWRQPADSWVASPNVVARNSLLWVYEGQTEFWGRVLAARSGMRTVEETLDKLAMDAASVAQVRGRAWKSLEDTTNDPLYVTGRTTVWPEWQRRKDYYGEGVLLWLDVHAQLDAQSHGRVGMDDFAHRFFAVTGTPGDVSTYTMADIAGTLAGLAPGDWQTYLSQRLEARDDLVLQGLQKMGWTLAYTDTPTATFLQDEKESGATNLSSSIGLSVDEKGRVVGVVWDSPAFKARMAPGETITQVNDQPFTSAGLLSAVRQTPQHRVVLSWKLDGKPHTAELDYAQGLRYPHLQRDPTRPDRLTALLRPRT
ncbi:hypothetical protein KPL74_05960 [Bacillus sp. NP157]|nr:hypothetical protein KPL74_05960 [Bacillus sp. NP157]